MKLHFLFIFLFISTFCVYGDDAVIRRITAKDGLGNNHVTCIAEDHEGNLWIGTNSGLFRYDGSQFIEYSLQSKPALAHNSIQAVFIDSLNHVWVGTGNGLDIIFQEKSTVLHFNFSNHPVYGFIHINRNSVWVNSHQFYEIIDYKLKKSIPITSVANLLYQQHFTYGIKIKENHIWMNFSHRPSRLVTLKNDSIVSYQDMPGNLQSFYQNGIHYYVENNTLFESDLNQKKLVALALINSPIPIAIKKILVDHGGNIWISTLTGDLYYFEKKSRKILSLKQQLAAGEVINEMYLDHRGNVWLGTNEGLLGFNIRHSFKKIQFPATHEGETISSRRILELPNEYLFLYNRKIVSIPNVSETPQITTIAGKFNTPLLRKMVFNNTAIFKHDKTLNIDDPYYDIYDATISNNTVFVGIGRLLYWKHTAGNSDIGYTKEVIKDVLSIAHFNNSTWVGGEDGIYLKPNGIDQTSKFKDKNGVYTFHNQIIWDIKVFQTKVYIASNKGLAEIHPISLGYRVKWLIKNIPINCISFENDQKLWIGTDGFGLMLFNLKTCERKIYTTENGLSNNTIATVFLDQKHRLWTGTFFGLNYFDQKNQTFITFYKEDGLNSDEFNRKSYCVACNGLVIIGGINGFNYFNPDEIIQELSPINIKLTLIQKIDGDGNIQKQTFGLLDNQFVQLGAFDKELKIGFALNEMMNIGAHKYYYKIVGIHQEWQINKAGNFLTLHGLKPGSYEIQIRASLGNGQLSLNILRVNLKIDQVFYKTVWFIVLVFLAILTVVILLFRFRIKQLKLVNQLRLKIAADLHDEVGSSLVQIAMLSENWHNIPAEKQLQMRSKISGISRQSVDNLRDMVWSIDSRKDRIHSLVEKMQEYAYDTLEVRHIDYQFKIQKTETDRKLHLNFKQTVLFIFKESISNILKHSEATTVEIQLDFQTKIFSMQISNNCPIVKPNLSAGIGLTNIETRCKALGGNMEFHQNNELFVLKINIPL